MTQAVAVNKLNNKVGKLEREVRMLRSLFISVAGQDEEGSYRPEFVKEILGALEEKPNFAFKSRDLFLGQLKRL